MNEEEEPIDTSSKKRNLFSFGAIINYSIAANFIAAFITCVIVIGCIGTIQSDLSGNFNSNQTHLCFMFASCGPNKPGQNNCDFQPSTSHPCDGTMVGYAFVALMSAAFVISLLVKAFLGHDLNWTLYIEVPVLFVSILIEFALSVMLSIGNLTTCNGIKSYYGSITCDLAFPNYINTAFYHSARADIARNSVWFVFLFLFIALIVYIIRLIIFIRRKRKLAIQRTIDEEELIEDEPRPI